MHLTPNEYDLLVLLVDHVDGWFTHNRAWRASGSPHSEDAQYLRVLVGQLREKLADTGEPRLIRNEAGIGYRLTR